MWMVDLSNQYCIARLTAREKERRREERLAIPWCQRSTFCRSEMTYNRPLVVPASVRIEAWLVRCYCATARRSPRHCPILPSSSFRSNSRSPIYSTNGREEGIVREKDTTRSLAAASVLYVGHECFRLVAVTHLRHGIFLEARKALLPENYIFARIVHFCQNRSLLLPE